MTLKDYSNSVLKDISDYNRFDAIFLECARKLKERYNLPSFSLAYEGYQKGSALLTECIDMAKIIRKGTKRDIWFFNPGEITLFEYLDQELIKLLIPEVQKLKNKSLKLKRA